MNLSEAARFWSKRGDTRFFFRDGAHRNQKILTVRSPKGIGGLSFVLAQSAKSCTAPVAVSCAAGRIYIEPSVSAAEAEITIDLDPGEETRPLVHQAAKRKKSQRRGRLRRRLVRQ